MLRARPTNWFELITSRDQFAAAMQILAASGAAQLEAQPLEGSAPVLPHLDDFFARFDALEKRYGPYWPVERGDAGLRLENPIDMLQETLDTLTAWADKAAPVIHALQTCAERRSELTLIAALIASVSKNTPLAQMSAAQSKLLDHAIFFLPAGVPESLGTKSETQGILYERFPSKDGVFVIAIGAAQAMSAFHTEMSVLKAVPVPVPDFLHIDSAAHASQVQQKLQDNAQTEGTCQADLNALAAEFGLAEVLSRVAVLKWLHQNSNDIQSTKHTIRITGWTSSPNGDDLHAKLEVAGVNYVLNIASVDPDGNAPMVMHNPRWLKAFEFFPRMLGVPAQGDVDPSLLTALIAPLLFGYMFGDVGQGAVLVLVGLLLSPRMPFLFLLVPGGIAAMGFGVLFGSVFSMEGIIAPLWLHPLDHPITVLGVALAFGAAMLVLGMALDLLQSVWHGAAMRWALANGGLALAFLCLLGTYWVPVLLWGLPLGIALTAAGARDADGVWTWAALAKALAEFLEGLMRLLVSTVSFSRVGAFALAHAGLSTAIVGVSEAAGGVGFWVILLLGNLLILGLEGLVTGIQTTRLILFEFFIRFFKADGREFHPLTSPAVNGS